LRISGIPILPIAARRRRTGERGEDSAGAEVGDHEAARQAVEPAIECFVQVAPGRRRADRRTHHHEHRDRNQREVVEPRVEGLRHHLHGVEALKDEQEHDRERAQAERDRRPGEKYDERGDEDDRALRRRAHSLIPKGGSRPVSRQ
jgi:hypothetical protein